MAIAFVNLGASANPDINLSNNASSYANTSWTPPTDGIIVAVVKNSIATAGNKPAISGNSLTWVEIATHVADTGNAERITILAAFAAGATTGVTTIDFASETQLDCRVSFFQITGADESGTIANAFVTANAKTGNGTDTSGSVTLDAASDSDNRPICAFTHEANEATTPGWTQMDDLAGVAPTTGFETQYKDDAFSTAASASWTTSSDWVGLAIEVKAASSGLGGTVNQNTETDTAQAIAKSKSKAIGQNTETDLAQALTRSKRLLIGQNTEADTVQAVAWSPKHRTVALVTETDAAQVITPRKVVAVGQIGETDEAQPITVGSGEIVETVNQVSETDTTQAITPAKSSTIGQAVEADEAQSIASAKQLAVNQAAETDLSQVITFASAQAVLQAEETDSAQSITSRKVKEVAQASETDEAGAISHLTGTLVEQASETDTAQPITRIKIVTVSQVSETDLAQSLFPQKRVSVVQVTEIDLSQAFTAAKYKAVGQASETDSAQPIIEAGPIIVVVGQVTETDTALSITLFVADAAAHYIYIVPAESRVFLIPADAEETITDRTFSIPQELRITEVEHD